MPDVLQCRKGKAGCLFELGNHVPVGRCVADRLVEQVDLLSGFVDGVGCGFGIIAQGIFVGNFVPLRTLNSPD